MAGADTFVRLALMIHSSFFFFRDVVWVESGIRETNFLL